MNRFYVTLQLFCNISQGASKKKKKKKKKKFSFHYDSLSHLKTNIWKNDVVCYP